MKQLITDKPSKHYLKWLVIILVTFSIFYFTGYGIRAFFSKYSVQSPIVLRSPLYVKTSPKPTPKPSPKPSKEPTSLVPVAIASGPEVVPTAPKIEKNSLKSMVLSYFPQDQQAAVDWIIQRESTWNPNAVNSYSGACGLFQSYPCSKMGCDDLSNIQCQAAWGEAYIRSRYGDANNAKEHWLAYGSY